MKVIYCDVCHQAVEPRNLKQVGIHTRGFKLRFKKDLCPTCWSHIPTEFGKIWSFFNREETALKAARALT